MRKKKIIVEDIVTTFTCPLCGAEFATATKYRYGKNMDYVCSWECLKKKIDYDYEQKKLQNPEWAELQKQKRINKNAIIIKPKIVEETIVTTADNKADLW